MSIVYGSICSGIEAATVAWHPLGWKPAFFSEIAPQPRRVLQHHYPEVPLHGDFTTINYGDYAPIDLLVGGTPCQSFSVAGLRGGMADARGNLALEYLRLADRLRPRWVLWENVPGVLSSNDGRDFGSFLGGLGDLGYGFAYRVLDAQFFGLAQRRKRVFVVGYLGDWRRAAAVLFEPESLRGNPAPSRQARKDIAPTISARPTGGGGLGTDFDLDGGLIARLLNAHPSRSDGESETFVVAPTMRANGDAHSGFKNEDGLVMTLALRGRDGSPNLEVRTDGLANALLTPNGGRGGIGCGAVAFSAHMSAQAKKPRAVVHEMTVRRLMPIECERLQGFPDGYTLVPNKEAGNSMMADGPRYKMLGNSMAVLVMRWIGKRIAVQDAAAQSAMCARVSA
jgi:DNA (cytosine-5)-methyltransferase 1